MLRRLVALLSLAGIFLAVYMSLYKLGYIGTLGCTVGSCESVQSSPWATLFGLPVAVWGVGFYVAVFALAMVGTIGPMSTSPVIGWALLVLTGWGVLFSGWLTYLELYVIHAICQWCVVSAILATVLFGLVLMERPWNPPRIIDDGEFDEQDEPSAA